MENIFIIIMLLCISWHTYTAVEFVRKFINKKIDSFTIKFTLGCSIVMILIYIICILYLITTNI